MRITALVLGLFTGIAMFVHSMVVGLVSDVGEGIGEAFDDNSLIEESEELSAAAGGGIVAAIIVVIAAGLALKFPRAAMILFFLGAAITIPTGAASEFSDLIIWGILAALCGVFSFLSQDRALRRPLRSAAGKTVTVTSYGLAVENFCSGYGAETREGARFCTGCGGQLA